MRERLVLAVEGVVHGVGFRALIWRLAKEYRLGGFVRSSNGSVAIEMEGDHREIDFFVDRLRQDAPPSANIARVFRSALEPRGTDRFQTEPGEDAAGTVRVSAEVAVCDDRLNEPIDGWRLRNCSVISKFAESREEFAMHELSIAKSIVELALEQTALENGRVRAVHLRLGKLSGVTVDALQSAFQLATEQSPLDGSRLEIEEVPVIVRCPNCGDKPATDGLTRICSACGEIAQDLVSGHEVELYALELEPECRSTGLSNLAKAF